MQGVYVCAKTDWQFWIPPVLNDWIRVFMLQFTDLKWAAAMKQELTDDADVLCT